MYYWVVLLFSIASLMMYRIAGSGDSYKDRTLPSAEPYAASFVIQHKAAVDYAKAKVKEYGKLSEGEKAQFLDDYYTHGMNLTFDKYSPFAKVGFKESGVFTSKLFCSDNTDGASASATCPVGSVDFVITYGDIPEQFGSEFEKRIFLTALGKYTSHDVNVGIVEKTTVPSSEGVIRGSKRIISSKGGRTSHVPLIFGCTTGKDAYGNVMYVDMITDTKAALNFIDASCAQQ